MLERSRRWVAWKLVQLAHRLYDATYYERIYVDGPDGVLVDVVICGDEYGGGVSSVSGLDWASGRRFGSDCTVLWDPEYRPDWLDE